MSEHATFRQGLLWSYGVLLSVTSTDICAAANATAAAGGAAAATGKKGAKKAKGAAAAAGKSYEFWCFVLEQPIRKVVESVNSVLMLFL